MTDDVEMFIFGQLSQIREEFAQIREHLYGTRKPVVLDRADQNGLPKRLERRARRVSDIVTVVFFAVVLVLLFIVAWFFGGEA